MEKKIEEGSKAIAEFMGLTAVTVLHNVWIDYKGDPFKPDTERALYHSSWNWLMPACKKFDRLYEAIDELSDNMGYIMHCDLIDDAVTTYEIEPVFKALTEAITWYNNQSNQ